MNKLKNLKTEMCDLYLIKNKRLNLVVINKINLVELQEITKIVVIRLYIQYLSYYFKPRKIAIWIALSYIITMFFLFLVFF